MVAHTRPSRTSREVPTIGGLWRTRAGNPLRSIAVKMLLMQQDRVRFLLWASAPTFLPPITQSVKKPARAVLPLRDPAISLIVRAVDTAFALHNKKDGATVSLPYGNMAGRKFFAVSTYPARTIKLWERPTWEQLFDFAKANLELLLKPNHAIGTWYDGWECVHVFDVVLLVADRDAALETALRFGQKAIFNLASRREISVLRPNAALLQHGGGVGNG